MPSSTSSVRETSTSNKFEMGLVWTMSEILTVDVLEVVAGVAESS